MTPEEARFFLSLIACGIALVLGLGIIVTAADPNRKQPPQQEH